ncbi:MAG TPA: glycosyltransferase family 2 protein [Vicinamibacterales bacterium]|nr:glycosyltransferase family 2 protein [Vicinamibacterales bacterium]
MTLNVAALIPAYNEGATIGDVVRGIRPFVSRVLVVDDGSSDGTGDAARAAGAEVVAHTSNLGKGHAVRTGLARILGGETTHVLMLDGDMQHLPEEAPRLIDAAGTSGADVVIGERQFDPVRMPASRYHTNRIGSRALSSFVGIAIDDTHCGFRLFRADTLRRMHLSARGYDIETEMLIKLRRLGGRVMSVPVSAVYNGRRSKLRPIRDTTRTCFLAVYYRFLQPL